MLHLTRRSWNGQTDQAIWTCVFLITLIGVVLIVPFAQSDPPGPGGGPEAAQSIRWAVACGPIGCLPALLTDNAHPAMINHARSFVADQARLRQTDEGTRRYARPRVGGVRIRSWVARRISS